MFNVKYMKEKIFSIINQIRSSKDLSPLSKIDESMLLREDLEMTSFDLAELTVRIEDEYGIDIFEDGLVNTVGEIYAKLQK